MRSNLTELQHHSVICLICWCGFCKLHCRHACLLSAFCSGGMSKAPSTVCNITTEL